MRDQRAACNSDRLRHVSLDVVEREKKGTIDVRVKRVANPGIRACLDDPRFLATLLTPAKRSISQTESRERCVRTPM